MTRKSFTLEPCTLKTSTAVVSQDKRVHLLQYVSLCAIVIKSFCPYIMFFEGQEKNNSGLLTNILSL